MRALQLPQNAEVLLTFLAPALRTMSTIWLMVVPRTMLSSTSSTLLPSNTAGIALSLRRTDSSRVRWSGMMNVRPTYLQTTQMSQLATWSSSILLFNKISRAQQSPFQAVPSDMKQLLSATVRACNDLHSGKKAADRAAHLFLTRPSR